MKELKKSFSLVCVVYYYMNRELITLITSRLHFRLVLQGELPAKRELGPVLSQGLVRVVSKQRLRVAFNMCGKGFLSNSSFYRIKIEETDTLDCVCV
jgi:hypothetical protein